MSEPRPLRARLRDLLPRDPDPVPDATPGDLAAFDDECAARLLETGRAVTALGFLATLVWWPLDAAIFDGVRTGGGRPVLFRLVTLSACGAFQLLPRSAAVRRAAWSLLAALFATVMAGLSHTAGNLGGLDLPWFHLAYPLFALPIMFPLRLGPRAALSTVQAAGWLFGLLALHTDKVYSQYLSVMLSMVSLVGVVCVACGHYLFLLHRSNFLQARKLSRTAAQQERLVVERTDELRRLLAHAERTRDDERARISREVHDELGQELSALRYALGFTRSRYAAAPDGIAGNLDELEKLLRRASQTTRALVSELRPQALEELGLEEAASWLIEQTRRRSAEIACDLHVEGSVDDVGADVAVVAYRVLQESLTNVVRHAEAGSVSVRLRRDPARLELTVQDDGVGIAGARAKSRGSGGGFGMIGMRERAQALGGTLAVTEREGGGTVVRCTLPLRGGP